MGTTRRSAIVGIGAAAVVGSRRVAAERTATTITGRLITADGEPIVGREIHGTPGSDRVVTDDDGRFSFEGEVGEQYGLGLYKSGSTEQYDPVANGVPHLYDLGNFDVQTEEAELGDIEVPQAHVVKLRALDRQGNPVGGATPGYQSGNFGAGEFGFTTNLDGYAVIEGTQFRRVEFVGPMEFSMAIPQDDGGEIQYQTREFVSEPMEIVFQIGSGARVVSEATDTPTDSSTPSATPTDAPTPSATPTASATPTDSPTPRRTTTAGAGEKATSTPPPRGFISNGSDAGNLGVLTDPFVLTVGGFALSVLGIFIQMVQGD